MVLIKMWHVWVLIFLLMSGWRWRDLSLKETSNHIRLDYILFYSVLTFFLLHAQMYHCSPFGSHLDILFQSLTSFLLLQLELWENQKSQSVTAHSGDLRKSSGDAFCPHLGHPACTPPHLLPGRWQPCRSISLRQRGLACECLGSALPGCSASSTLDPLQWSSCFSSR